MQKHPGRLFVLGAGFTRAFAPEAPLLWDDFGLDILAQDFRNFRTASQVIEIARDPKTGKCDFEKLLTRIDSQMPYDTDEARAELSTLKFRLIRQLTQRIQRARESGHWSDLAKFAKYCVDDQANCITFNYDDFLDEQLYLAKPPPLNDIERRKLMYWHPDGGYGFFCVSADQCVVRDHVFMDSTSMYLIKLHGSLNWKIRKGHRRPLAIESIVNDETWVKPQGYESPMSREQVERHLEPDPFIIAPVLNKAELGMEPITKLLWNLALRHIENAREVIFLGYSMPRTDFMAATLFSEAIRKNQEKKVTVVSTWGTREAEIKQTYAEVLGFQPEFVTADARDWIAKNATLD